MTPPQCNCAHVETIVVWTRGAKEPKPQRHDRCAHPTVAGDRYAVEDTQEKSK